MAGESSPRRRPCLVAFHPTPNPDQRCSSGALPSRVGMPDSDVTIPAGSNTKRRSPFAKRRASGRRSRILTSRRRRSSAKRKETMALVVDFPTDSKCQMSCKPTASPRRRSPATSTPNVTVLSHRTTAAASRWRRARNRSISGFTWRPGGRALGSTRIAQPGETRPSAGRRNGAAIQSSR